MKFLTFAKFAAFGISTILFRRKKPIVGTVIVGDRCNLHCRHCSVNNITGSMYPYEQLCGEMRALYAQGVRILFFCGGSAATKSGSTFSRFRFVGDPVGNTTRKR